jgi:hypothetical protein
MNKNHITSSANCKFVWDTHGVFAFKLKLGHPGGLGGGKTDRPQNVKC